MEKPFICYLTNYLHTLNGIIFINSALFAKTNLSFLTNNNIIFITADKQTRINRLKSRNYSATEIHNRINSQLDDPTQLSLLPKPIITFDNSFASTQDIEIFARMLLKTLKSLQGLTS
jgi:dephospho-CoA kinase